MAALYLAEPRSREGPAKVVAIKVIHSSLTDDPTLVRMFKDETAISARIQHPNVVRVYEVGEAMGTHYLVMEYVHGSSLSQVLRGLIRARRRMAPELAVHIACKVADALHAAHELKNEQDESLNVVHRDISPQNILLSHTGAVKLIDFGIAKSRASQEISTKPSLKGKLRYMSPEHARGIAVDRRTDIYALGVVLWEMITTRALFWAPNDYEMLMAVQKPNVGPPSAHVAGVSRELDRAVLWTLSVDRDHRPATALALRHRLLETSPLATVFSEAHVADLLKVILGADATPQLEELPATITEDLSSISTEQRSQARGAMSTDSTATLDGLFDTVTLPGIEGPTEQMFRPDAPTPAH